MSTVLSYWLTSAVPADSNEKAGSKVFCAHPAGLMAEDKKKGGNDQPPKGDRLCPGVSPHPFGLLPDSGPQPCLLYPSRPFQQFGLCRQIHTLGSGKYKYRHLRAMGDTASYFAMPG